MSAGQLRSVRDGFGDALVALGERQHQVVVVNADLGESVRTRAFAERFPTRSFEVGVAEQNAIGVAAGLAKEGWFVFVASFAAFSPGRTHDQIRLALCESRRPVCVVGGHGGITVGADGRTQQSLEDLALMQVLPNMTVCVPGDYTQARLLPEQLVALRTPSYLRLSRPNVPDWSRGMSVVLGKALELRHGDHLTLASTGIMQHRALLLADELATRGITADVLQFHTIRPLDTDTLRVSAQRTGHVLTLEEHQRFGGFGSTVALALGELPVKVRAVAVNNVFGRSGNPEELLDAYGFSLPTLVTQARELLAD